MSKHGAVRRRKATFRIIPKETVASAPDVCLTKLKSVSTTRGNRIATGSLASPTSICVRRNNINQMPEYYVRFVVAQQDERTRQKLGIFTQLYELEGNGELA